MGFDDSGAIFNSTTILIYLAISLFLTIFLLYFYTSKNRLSWYNYLCLGFTYWLGFGSLFLITIDISSVIHQNEISPVVYTVMHFFWIVVYWSIQLLAWVIIPILQSYVEQGHFSVWRRILGALFENLILYIVFFVVLGAIGAVALVFIILVQVSKDNFSYIDLLIGIPDMLMQASNIFGMTLLFLLMGYGVIALPRTYWNKANLKKYLKRLEFKASQLNQTIEEKSFDLGEMLKVIEKSQNLFPEGSKNRKHFNILLSKKKRLEEHYKLSAIRQETEMVLKGTNSSLVKFHKRFIRTFRQYKKKRSELKMIEEKAFFVHDILRAKLNRTGVITGPFRKPRRFLSDLFDRLEYLWYCKLYKLALRLFAIILSLFCLTVVWSEFSIIIYTITKGNVNLSVYYWIAQFFSFNKVAVQISLMFLMAGFFTIIYFALFDFRFADFYALIPGNSDASTLLFTGVILVRVVPALLLNFVLILHAADGANQTKTVAFFKVNQPLSFEKLRIVPILEWIFDLFPLLIVVVAIVTLFTTTFLSRLSFLCGNLHDFIFHEKKSLESIKDGRQIILTDKKKLAHELGIAYNSDIDKSDDAKKNEVNLSDSEIDSIISDDDNVRINMPNNLELREINVSSSDDDNNNTRYTRNTRSRLEEIYKKHGRKLPTI